MGPHDGVEVCELVGIFIPFQLSSICNKNDIGLYRVDGLAIFRNAIGPQAEKIKKHFQNIFRKNNLNIIVKCNLKMVGVTLNPLDGSYKPFHKPNSEISYIHRESNHPPSIIKQLPLCVESLLSKLSSDENVFIQAAFVYQEALKRAGYNHKLSYDKSNKCISNNNDNNNNNSNNNSSSNNDNNNNNNYNNKVKFNSNENSCNNNNNNNNDKTENPRTRKRRKKNTICFNPPFSKNVATNIGRYVLNLIDKHFPRHHKFHKILNRNNIKVSYSCMPIIKSAINSHNRKILHPPVNSESRTCNCIKKTDCPLQEKSFSENALYQADITSENFQKEIY